MILSTLQIVIPSEKWKDAHEILRMYLGPACYQPGCISCHAYQEMDNKNSMILMEKWTKTVSGGPSGAEVSARSQATCSGCTTPNGSSTVSWCSQPGVEYLVTVGNFSDATTPGIVQVDFGQKDVQRDPDFHDSPYLLPFVC